MMKYAIQGRLRPFPEACRLCIGLYSPTAPAAGMLRKVLFPLRFKRFCFVRSGVSLSVKIIMAQNRANIVNL